MQSVSAAFTAEEKDTVRKVIGNVSVSWKKDSILSNRTFTIGVSTIGGNDIMGINPGAIGSPGNYRYFDESQYAMHMAWERELKAPAGGMSKAMAEARLSNTSGRFLPRYMGGTSELFTAIQTRAPIILNAGFNFNGIDQVIPQFAGILNRPPRIDSQQKTIDLNAYDYLDYFQNKYVDQSAMYTGINSGTLIRNVFADSGMSTAQYELDTGINIIPFAMFETGTNIYDILDKIAEAENGFIYQDEEGIFRFENRQHWSGSPHNTVQYIMLTGQVINAEAPSDDHIINVVEIKSKQRRKHPEEIIFNLAPFDFIELPSSTTTEVFVNFDDPVLSLTTPSGSGSISYFKANSESDSGGTDVTSNVSITKVTRFAQAAKIEFRNSSSSIAYITSLVITGRAAPVERDIYTRAVDNSSVTAYQERKYIIEDNPFIQNQSWAESLAQMIINDYSQPENLQVLTVKAKPSLQLGDLISWQGRYWRIFKIRTRLDPSGGFVQEITVLQRTITSYFRIGFSTIGGSDRIAP